MITLRKGSAVCLILMAATHLAVLCGERMAFADGEICGGIPNGAVRCDSATESTGAVESGKPTPVAEYVQSASCGPRVHTPTDKNIHEDVCFEASIYCLLRAGEHAKPNTQVVEYNVYSTQTRQWLRTEINCDVPLASTVPAIAAVKAEVTKRAPRLYAATGGIHFPVNAAVVFFLSADKPRPLDEQMYTPASDAAVIPEFELGGHKFQAQLKLIRSQWNWDDDSKVPDGSARQDSEFTSWGPAGPLGEPYDEKNPPCESNRVCSKYLSHAWHRIGKAQVTVRTFWQGLFSVDGGVPIPIPGEIFSDSPGPKTLEIKEYRTVLLDPNIDPDYRPD